MLIVDKQELGSDQRDKIERWMQKEKDNEEVKRFLSYFT